MAKQKKMLPARKLRDRSRDDDSLLLRSAESLGRVIGALQRQLDGVTKRLPGTADTVTHLPPGADGNSRPPEQAPSPRSTSRTRATSGTQTSKGEKGGRGGKGGEGRHGGNGATSGSPRTAPKKPASGVASRKAAGRAGRRTIQR